MSDTMHALHATQLGNRVVVLDGHARQVASATVPGWSRGHRATRDRTSEHPGRDDRPAA